jgi:hypothetical protein
VWSFCFCLILNEIGTCQQTLVKIRNFKKILLMEPRRLMRMDGWAWRGSPSATALRTRPIILNPDFKRNLMSIGLLYYFHGNVIVLFLKPTNDHWAQTSSAVTVVTAVFQHVKPYSLTKLHPRFRGTWCLRSHHNQHGWCRQHVTLTRQHRASHSGRRQPSQPISFTGPLGHDI